MYVDVARDFVGVAFHVLLDGAKSSHNNRDCFVLSPNIRSTSISKSLYLVSFSVVLTEVLVSRGMVMSVRGQILAFLPFRNVRPISCYGPVSVDGHVPQNSDAVILGDSLGFMLIPSFLLLNAKLFADRPVHVCSCLVVGVCIQF